MKIFFLGSALTFEALNTYKGETPSATHWISGLLNGLIDNKVKVTTFSPIWDAMFPKGFLFPGNKKDLDSRFDSKLIKYINIKYIRDIHISNNIYSEIEKEITKGNIPDVIINYNLYNRYANPAKRIKKKYPYIKWVNLILDADDPRNDNWDFVKRKTSGSDASVLLSWWAYQNAPIDKKLHLDSGWTGSLPPNKIHSEKIFLYAGKMLDDGSFKGLIETIEMIDDKSVFFDFYGKGTNHDLIKLSKENPNVRIRGFVTDEELDIACSQATAFLSPRDETNQENIMIFPSKILVYLKYKKPIISPILLGIAPEYNNVLLTTPHNTPKEWNDLINRIITNVDDIIEKTKTKTEELLEHKKWSSQTKRLITFISEL